MTLTEQAVACLARWAEWTESQALVLPGEPPLRGYGSGYLTWGVQSNWNYMGALATLAAHLPEPAASRWRTRAVDALRLALATHVSAGGRPGADGRPWGTSWISMLGIERAMHGVAKLTPYLSPRDLADLRRVLVSEADWVLHHAQRGKTKGVFGGLWNHDGQNVPESNIWWATLLWRVAEAYPEEAHADAWRERARQYFINGVSIPADATDPTLCDGQPVAARFAGANFFPNYALDHHGYLNVGYMAICVSNAAILHFDLKAAGQARPAALDHHQADLWRVLRRMVLADGRLARIGGDSRVRYAYCQEYLLPSLLYAADHLGDEQAMGLLARQVAWIAREQASNADGAFYAHRLDWLAKGNPHYHCRLESDRAAALAMLLNYLPLTQAPPRPTQSFEAAVAGEWQELEHGAWLTRQPTRFASFGWRAHGLTQALVLPPGDSSLAEWSRNLAPVARFLGDQEAKTHRRLLGYTGESFAGGFVTCGAVMEGVEIAIDEGANCTDQALTHLAVAALPDAHTTVILQRVRAAGDRCAYLLELKGLHLNLPNDLFNDYQRTLDDADGRRVIRGPAERDETLALAGDFVTIDGQFGVRLIYGGQGLQLSRSQQRRGGKYHSLAVEELCSGVRHGPCRVQPGETLVDLGAVLVTSVSPATTATLRSTRLDLPAAECRGVQVTGQDGRDYAVLANFGSASATLSVFGQPVTLPPGHARVLAAG